MIFTFFISLCSSANISILKHNCTWVQNAVYEDGLRIMCTVNCPSLVQKLYAEIVKPILDSSNNEFCTQGNENLISNHNIILEIIKDIFEETLISGLNSLRAGSTSTR